MAVILSLSSEASNEAYSDLTNMDIVMPAHVVTRQGSIPYQPPQWLSEYSYHSLPGTWVFGKWPLCDLDDLKKNPDNELHSNEQ